MASKNRRRGPSPTTITTTQRVMPSPTLITTLSPIAPTSRVLLKEVARQYDRRLFDPTNPPNVNDGKKQTGQKTPLIHGNVETKRLSICAKRAIRKQVLFAAGIGGSKKRKRSPKRTIWSNIKC